MKPLQLKHYISTLMTFILLMMVGCNASNGTSDILDTSPTSPVITINGSRTISIMKGATYTEAGATVTNLDGTTDSAIVTGDTVDTNTVGEYTVVYSYMDSNGNYATNVGRTVRVRQPMVVVFRTNTAAESVTLPLVSGYDYDFTVDWGDSSSSTVTYATDPDRVHTYAAAGDYTVTVSGVAQAWSFNNTGSKAKIISVANFGDLLWKNLSGAFNGCSNLVSFSGGVTTDVTDMSYFLNNTTNLTSLDVSTFNTAKVTNMRNMFGGTHSLTSIDLSSFDTSNVTTFREMFWHARAATTINVSSFDTSKATTLNSMFSHSRSVITLNLSHFKTPNVTDLAEMFEDNHDLQNVYFSSSFDTSKVTDMGEMFQNTRSLLSLDISMFDTSEVTNMVEMFDEINVTTLNLANFDTSKVTDMGSMFKDTSNLTSLTTTDWDVTAVTNSTNIFTGKNAGLTVYCNYANLFGEACN